jgi:DNA-3-methyladenine glycosylase II
VWQETISIKGPYQFIRVLERLSLDPLQVVNLREQTVKIPLCINSEPVVVEIQSIGNIDEPKFTLKTNHRSDQALVIQRITEIFRWDMPMLNIHQHFSNSDLKEIFETHYGTPLILDFDPYNCLLKCIIHQQLNLSFAHKLTERFVHTFGFEIDGVWFYPKADKIASLRLEDLRELQFSGRKAEYAIGISQAIMNGEIDLKELKYLSNEEIFNILIKFKGIGPWTIQNVLMFGYGRDNLFPATDIGIQNALKKLYKLERKPSLDEIEQYKKPWEPYLSYASLYLWRSIE